MKINKPDLREFGAEWIEREIGEEYVDDFLYYYDMANRGIPFNNVRETTLFARLMDRIKDDWSKCKI